MIHFASQVPFSFAACRHRTSKRSYCVKPNAYISVSRV